MKDILSDTQLMDRSEFVSELVDLFYRASKTKRYIMFEDLTSYLIEHEIESSKPLEKSNFEYSESKIVDQTTHNNYIGKIYYFDKLDKMILYEHNNRIMRIYEGKTMRLKKDKPCDGVILAIEFISKKKMIAVLLSNKKINFYDPSSKDYKIFRELEVPCTQRCLCYVENKDVLFSAGTNGAIFAWELGLIFSNEFAEDELKRAEEKKNFDYRKYLAYNTPWFEQENILCIVDLPNINFLATGSCDNKIRLWDLRSSSKMDKIEEKSGLKSFDNLKIETSGKATFKSKEKTSKRKTK
jgi:WD40 repeat protein